MKFHPYSEVFPLLDGAELDALAADIKAHGLREKIWLHDGKILDGRNRFLACKKAGIEARFRKFAGDDPLAFVVSLNIERRHLSPQQRASAANKVATLSQGRPKTGPGTGLTQAQAAEKFNVSESSMRRDRRVKEKGSAELQQAVERDEVPLKRAAAVTNLPKREQLKAAQAPAVLEERWTPDIDEDEQIAAMEREQEASLQKWFDADNKLEAAHAEIKRQAAEIATLKLSRDGYMNRCGELVRNIKALQRKLDKAK